MQTAHMAYGISVVQPIFAPPNRLLITPFFCRKINRKIAAAGEEAIAIGSAYIVWYSFPPFFFCEDKSAKKIARPKVNTRLIPAISKVIAMIFQKVSLERTRTQFEIPAHFVGLPRLSVRKKDSATVFKKG